MLTEKITFRDDHIVVNVKWDVLGWGRARESRGGRQSMLADGGPRPSKLKERWPTWNCGVP